VINSLFASFINFTKSKMRKLKLCIDTLVTTGRNLLRHSNSVLRVIVNVIVIVIVIVIVA
jgi:hypothetical protein